MELRFFRTTSQIKVSTWDEKARVFIEVVPPLEGNAKGQPKAGEHRFNYDGAIRISFRLSELLTTSYVLLGMSQGMEGEFSKFADMAKTGSGSTDKKTLKISAKENGGFFVNMNMGKDKVSIAITNEELYAIGKFFEIAAQKFYNNPEVKEDIVEE